jgi:peptidoglycan/xylan/chitin deacetylase (PgdA/CDA1 family)
MKLTSKAYLTIDDSPSTRMDDLVDYLESKKIPALFFCRGDRLEENSSSAIRALQKGFVLGNHAYSHQRSSQRDFHWIVDEIDRTEKLLDDLHAAAQVPKRGKFFRFPQLDRGTAGWIVDYDTYNDYDRSALIAAFAEGLNVQSMERPALEDFEKRDLLQRYLKEAGYVQPFKDVTHAWFKSGEIAQASDCLYTFSNCDWMLTQRHLGKWPYKTAYDLKQKALNDGFLSAAGSVNVILAHDQAEIVDLTIELLEDLRRNGLEFLPF